MNQHEADEQARLQLRAEQAEQQGLPPTGDSSVDGYRLVMRALRAPLAQQLPADFAAGVAMRVSFPEDNTRLEDGLMSLLLLAMAVTALVYVRPVMANVLGHLHVDLPSVPWPLLGAAAVSVALAWALDRGVVGWHERPHAR